MFKTRLLSGILLVIIALVTVITGGNLLFAVLLLISLIGMTELYKVFHIEKKAPGIVGYIFAILYYGLLYFKPLLPGESLNWFVMLFMAFLICQMAVLVFSYPKYNTQQIFAGFFGMFYVAVMLSYIYQTRNLPGGIFSVWLVFVCSWGCDTCAYCVGMLIGKHKLAPILSPKKSIEGGIGGILGAALIGVLYGLAINYWGNAAADILEYAIIGAGSLLGVAEHDGTGFPVGKVEFMDLYPLTFQEFLCALGEERFVNILQGTDTDMVTTFKSKYIDRLREYYYVGGMP